MNLSYAKIEKNAEMTYSMYKDRKRNMVNQFTVVPSMTGILGIGTKSKAMAHKDFVMTITTNDVRIDFPSRLETRR